MRYPELIILDIETTGVDSTRDDIIEIAAVKLNAAGTIVDQLDLLMGTEQILSPTVMVLTGITPDQLRDQPKVDELVPRIQEFVGAAPIVGHNIGFDVEFLTGKGCDFSTNPILDTLELAHTVLPSQDYYSLEYLAHHFGFPHQPAHRAMADVLATVDLVKFLFNQVAELMPATLGRINKLVPADTWSWQWLFAEPIKFTDFKFSPVADQPITDQIITEARSANDALTAIKTSRQGKLNFIEAHFPIDPLSLGLAHAVSARPAVLVITEKLLHQIDWTKVVSELGVSIAPYLPSQLRYRDNAEGELVASGLPTSSQDASLLTKVAIWRNEWGSDWRKLYLSREAKYQWEQKLAPLDGEPPAAELVDIVVATPAALLEIPNLGHFEVVISDPLWIEDAVFGQTARVFSVNYFSAAINSRRDFVHQYIKPRDVKIADAMFKALNHASAALAKLTTEIATIYQKYPPTSVYERNIELDEG
ncbi:MAG: 3'-5' exonuclease, partial [bacterium]